MNQRMTLELNVLVEFKGYFEGCYTGAYECYDNFDYKGCFLGLA